MELENPAILENSSRFTKLFVSGFRRLQNIYFEIRPLCVMIGANGVGKTSTLEVFSLLASSAAGHLSSALSELGGFNSVLSFGGAEDLKFEVFAVASGRTLRYLLQLRPERAAYSIENESLWLRRETESDEFEHLRSNRGDVWYRESINGPFLKPNWEYNPRESALSQAPKSSVFSKSFAIA